MKATKIGWFELCMTLCRARESAAEEVDNGLPVWRGQGRRAP